MVAFDSSSAGSQSGGSLSVAHSIAASGNSRILVVYFFGYGGSNAATKFSSVQYDGVAGTQITPDAEAVEFGNYFSVQAFYWLESDLPAGAGSYNITATAAGGQFNGGCVATSFTDVFQSAPTDVARNVDATGTPSSSTVSLTTTEADEVIVDAAFGWGTVSLSASTPTAGQTTPTPFENNGGNAGVRLSVGYEEIATPGANSQTWSFSGTCNLFAAFAVGLAPHSAANIETGNVAQGNAGGTTAHTLTASDNRIVVVMVDDESTTQASGVTYDGTAMTLVASSTATTGAGNASSMWAILDADLPVSGGSYNVSVTGLDAGASVSVVELNNVAQVIPSGSAVDTTETGAVLTSTATATAPTGHSISLGCLGQGAYAAVTLNSPPTGTGTWTRLFAIGDPPTSAQLGCGYQFWDTSGAKDYTETASGGADWFRASQIHAIFAAYTPDTTVDLQGQADGVATVSGAIDASPISFVGEDTSISGSDTLTLDVPAGVQDDDFLMAIVINQDDQGSDTWTPPSGWTLLIDNLNTGGAAFTPPGTSVYYRIASSEPADYNWQLSASGRGLSGAMLAWRGVDTTTPIDVTPTTAVGDPGAPNPPSITPVTDSSQVVAVGVTDDDSDAFTALSTGYSVRILSFANDSGSGNGATLGVCDIEVDPAAAEDPSVFTSAGSQEWAAISIALRPQGAGEVVDVAGQADGVADVSGGLAVQTVLEGQADGVADVSASLSVTTALEGQADGVADVGGSLVAQRGVAGQADGVADVSGALQVTTTLEGQADGVADVSAALAKFVGLAAAVDGVSNVTAALAVRVTLGGSADGVAAVGADLARGAALDASVVGTGGVSGALSVLTLLGGQADGIGTVAGILARVLTGTGVADGVASVSGDLAVQTTLEGQADGVSTVDGNLAVQTALEGQADGVGDVSGDLAVQTVLEGQADGVADVSGELKTPQVDVEGQADGVASVDGSLQIQTDLLGQADGVATVQGDVQVTTVLEGQADGVADVGAELGEQVVVDGQADGVADVAAQLEVLTNLEGQADGTSTVDGDVFVGRVMEGQADGVAVVDGTLVVETDLQGQADGVADVEGALSIQTVLAGQADGVATVGATLGGEEILEADVDGVADVSGALDIQTQLTGQADGVAAVDGTVDIYQLLVAESDGTAVVAAELSVLTRLVAQADGASTVEATLQSIDLIEANVDGVADVAGNLMFLGDEFYAEVDGASTVEGQLEVITRLAAETIGQAGVSGELEFTFERLNADVRGRGRVSAELVCVRLEVSAGPAPQTINTSIDNLGAPNLQSDTEVIVGTRIISKTRKL